MNIVRNQVSNFFGKNTEMRLLIKATNLFSTQSCSQSRKKKRIRFENVFKVD